MKKAAKKKVQVLGQIGAIVICKAMDGVTGAELAEALGNDATYLEFNRKDGGIIEVHQNPIGSEPAYN